MSDVGDRMGRGRGLNGLPKLRSSLGARPGDRALWRVSQAHGVGARRLRGKTKTCMAFERK